LQPRWLQVLARVGAGVRRTAGVGPGVRRLVGVRPAEQVGHGALGHAAEHDGARRLQEVDQRAGLGLLHRAGVDHVQHARDGLGQDGLDVAGEVQAGHRAGEVHRHLDPHARLVDGHAPGAGVLGDAAGRLLDRLVEGGDVVVGGGDDGGHQVVEVVLGRLEAVGPVVHRDGDGPVGEGEGVGTAGAGVEVRHFRSSLSSSADDSHMRFGRIDEERERFW
jgi:hypothetical protein